MQAQAQLWETRLSSICTPEVEYWKFPAPHFEGCKEGYTHIPRATLRLHWATILHSHSGIEEVFYMLLIYEKLCCRG